MTKEFFTNTYIVSYLVGLKDITITTQDIQNAESKALVAWESYWTYIYTK